MTHNIVIELKSGWNEVILAPVSTAKTLNNGTVYEIGEGDNTFHNSRYVEGGVDVKVLRVTVMKNNDIKTEVLWPDGKVMEIDVTSFKVHRSIVDEVPPSPDTVNASVNPAENAKAVEISVSPNPTKNPVKSKPAQTEPKRTSRTIATEILKEAGGVMDRAAFKAAFESQTELKAGLNRLFSLWAPEIQYDVKEKKIFLKDAVPETGLEA